MSTFEFDSEEEMDESFEYYMDLKYKLLDAQSRMDELEDEMRYLEEEIESIKGELKEYE